MATLDDLRRAHDAARAARDSAVQTQSRGQQELYLLERAARELRRTADPNAEGGDERLDRLAAAAAETEQKIADARASRMAAAKELARLNVELKALTDPRTALGALDARFPLLLFPVRLETRFATRSVEGQEKRQLLVRIYPDDCLVDSFDPDLSESEVTNLRRYWCSTYAAGGSEARERAAWRELAGAHGTGRACYLTSVYVPLPASDPRPAPDPNPRALLAVAIDAAPSALERAAIRNYFTAVFRAGSNQAAKELAFTALRGAVGAARAGEVQQELTPPNLNDPPPPGTDRVTVPVTVLFVVLQSAAAAATKRQAWTRAPEARLLPDRFVLLADSGPEHVEVLGEMVPQPLLVGPDPLAVPGEQFSDATGDLNVPTELEWLTDFETARAVGMGFQLDLTPRQAEVGFDRLYVVGVRLKRDPDEGRMELESLISHQAQSQAGFALVPQGTPTNNSEQSSSGWSRIEEADDLFDVVRLTQNGQAAFDPNATAPYDRRDGLVLAEALGIDAAVLQSIANANRRDQAEMRAMNAALFPATLGYFMDTAMRPVFDAATIEHTRRHFIECVSGRGVVPSVRIGKQPYGILPTLAFSRLPVSEGDVAAEDSDTPDAYLARLHGLLRRVQTAHFDALANAVPRVGRWSSDPQRDLLQILGLHASSVEFHLDVVESVDRYWNAFKFFSTDRTRLKVLLDSDIAAGEALLRTLGYAGETPDVVRRLFSDVHGPGSRPTIDDAPLSETDVLPACTDDGLNYVAWCRTKAESSFDDLRLERGFSGNKAPDALFYHVLRHALQLGYHGTAVELFRTHELLSRAELEAQLREPPFVHVKGPARDDLESESRYKLLYRKEEIITGTPGKTVAELVPRWLAVQDTGTLPEQVEALRVLEQASTAALERAFAEHIDLCSYRFDAWMLSLVNARLHRLREGGEQGRRLGIYLGAFGWLEGVKPKERLRSDVQLDPKLAPIFARPSDPPLQRDPQNGGSVLAPSLNHAVTSAVLRAGYLGNAGGVNPDAFAVDLSSGRVRVALDFIEGIRSGQPLGALLGYEFERRLHDRHAEAELDALVFEIRRAFPLASKQLIETTTPAADGAPIESVEARNVCDGLRLIDHVRRSTNKSYPWGKDLAPASNAQRAIIDQEVTALFEIDDAIGDLALAEGVHQLTTGNADRAAAAMDAFGKGGFPPEPDVVTTPRSGTTLVHRVALHLPLGAVAAAGDSPRAKAEPAVESWLTNVLPPLANVFVRVAYQNAPAGSAPDHTDIAVADLGINAVDLLYLLDNGNEQAMNDLDDRIVAHVLSDQALCPDASVTIYYTEPLVGQITLFELAPLVASLRTLLLESRSLKATDAALQNEATVLADAARAIPAAQVSAARQAVLDLQVHATALDAVLAPLVNPSATVASVVAGADGAVASFLSLQGEASLAGFSLSAATALAGCREWFAFVRGKASALAKRWQAKLDRFAPLWTAGNDAALSDLMRVDALVRAEREVSTQYTVPLPDVPGPLLAVVGGKVAAFSTAQTAVVAVRDSAATAIATLWNEWSATFAGRSSLDLDEPDRDDEETRLRGLLVDLRALVAGLLEEIARRVQKGDALLAQAATANADQRVVLTMDATKAFLGDGFRIIARFALSAEHADEWQNAFNARQSLMAHLTPAHPFPVDDWLYGVARVRSRLGEWENIVMLSAAFATTEPVLSPVQFPFRADEPWLALELPSTFALDAAGDHLLYTACYPGDTFDKTAPEHGGLLLDEWTEVVPAKSETAGLAFHFDRPGQEPPQTLLLVTPASAGKVWTWDDLSRAIPETFELAKKRAIEPDPIAATTLARLLPATAMATTTRGISIGVNLRAAAVAARAMDLDHG